jgi:hypothetical protein
MEVQVCAETQEGAYTFSCPACATIVRRDADRHVVQILVSGGVRVRVWQLPTELYESHDGPAINWDDVLDFHTLLDSEGWFDQVQSLTR